MIKLLILDVDGVLTDGRKTYDDNGLGCYKVFCDKDFTGIKRLKSSNVDVCFLSGDENVNRAVAKNRDIDFYYSRGEEKADYLDMFSEKYNCDKEQMIYVGDDIFDLEIMKQVGKSYCVNSSPLIIRNQFDSLGDAGDNLISKLYDIMFGDEPVLFDKILELDKRESF